MDLGDPELLTSRHWPWLRTRVLGVLSRPDSRTRALLMPPPAIPTT